MCSKLAFYYNRNDPNFTSKEVIIQATPYIGNWFFTFPLYDNDNKKIGNESSDAYVQEDSDGKYLVRDYSTFFINDKGSISWQSAYINEQPKPYFRPGIKVKARIISGTGDYVNANGCVNIIPKIDGHRDVVISYKS